MKLKDFLNEISEFMQTDNNLINIDTVLEGLPGWNSMGRLLIVAFVEERFNHAILPDDIKNCKTVGSIVDLVEAFIEE